MTKRYVVYRTFLGDLDFLREGQWDKWRSEVNARTVDEVSRGHTITEALNLTQLVNKQTDLENQE